MRQSIIMDDSEIMDILFIGKWPKTKQNDDKRKLTENDNFRSRNKENSQVNTAERRSVKANFYFLYLFISFAITFPRLYFVCSLRQFSHVYLS